MDLKTTILMFALICALAGVFVLLAKWEEEKVKTKDEHECFEAMRRMYSGLSALAQEKDAEIAYWKEANDDKIGEILFYHAEYGELESVANRSEIQRIQMQDRLSALLCPHNDHVWKDGRCVKCGRVKDD